MIKVDFTGVEGGFEKISPGKYLGTVVKIEEKMSQAGKPYLNWQLKLQGEGVNGRVMFYITSLAPNALWNLKGTLQKAFGMTSEELSGPLDLDIEDFLGREVCVVVGEEEYNGEMRDRVLSLLDPSEAMDMEGALVY